MLISIGDKVRTLRKSKGYSLEKLADLSNCSVGYIWQLEKKKLARPSSEKIAKIAAVLDISVDFLLDQTETFQPENATDISFFCKYKKMSEDAKIQIRSLVDLLSDVK